MKFSLKVFAGIFFVTTAVLGAAGLSILHFVTIETEAEYAQRYKNFAAQLGDTLVEIDKAADAIMLNALYFMRERERAKGLPSNTELLRLAKQLGVGSLYVVDVHGKYLRSDYFETVRSDPKLRSMYPGGLPLTKSLFSYCSDYRRLTTGQSSIERTPIIPSGDLDWPFKFMMIPNHNGTRILEVDIPMQPIGSVLTKVMQADPNALSIGLFTPSGAALGQLRREGTTQTARAPLKPTGIIFDVPQRTPTGLILYTKVPAITADCCECKVRGITDQGGRYYYILRTEISRKALAERIAAVRKDLVVAFLAALLFSGLLAFFVSLRLVKRLAWIGTKVREIAETNGLSARLRMAGRDEVATLANTFDSMMDQLEASQSRLASAERERAFAEMARQVGHDIRSPLAALDTILGDVSALPENARVMVRSAVTRIHDITNTLLDRQRAKQSAQQRGDAGPARVQPILLSSVIASVVSEKRLEFKGRPDITIEANVGAASYGIFASVEPSQLKRVLSNLISNGVEALPGKGSVTISLVSVGGMIEVAIHDTGIGIAPELLARLGQPGETHGKPGGSGLGLHHARTSVEAWGGSLALKSEVGRGTTVTMKVPAASPPEWFAPQIDLTRDSIVVVLDDDPTIHQIWKRRFESELGSDSGIRLVHCSKAAELRRWVTGNVDAATAIYLLDYELGCESETGLALAKELNLTGRAILVTSRFEDQAILDECIRLGLRLIPKVLAGFVPIACPLSSGLDAVLIDDDRLVHTVWTVAARNNGKRLAVFSTPREFMVSVGKLDKRTPIYVDSNLGDGIRGEEFTKELHAQGFRNLYLATGRQPDTLPPMPWIIEVVGKKSPWS